MTRAYITIRHKGTYYYFEELLKAIKLAWIDLSQYYRYRGNLHMPMERSTVLRFGRLSEHWQGKRAERISTFGDEDVESVALYYIKSLKKFGTQNLLDMLNYINPHFRVHRDVELHFREY